MAGKTRYVDVGTTAVRVSNTPGDAIAGSSINVENPPTNTVSVWWGYSSSVIAGPGTKTDGLTGTGGKEIRPGENTTVDLDPSEVVYLRAAVTGPTTVQIHEVGI